MTGAFTDEQKRLIAGQARTLRERLEAPDALDHGAADATDVTDVLDDWRDTFPDEEAFERRLDRMDATVDDCRRAIAVDRLADDEPLPDWIEVVDELARAIRESAPDDSPDRIAPERVTAADDSEGAHPFGELAAAVAIHARERLPEEPARTALSTVAIDAMTEWFRIRFEQRFVRILYVEFKTYVAAHDRDLAFADPDEFDDPPTEYYEQFVEELFSGGFEELCLEYPMFARLVATQMRQWREHLEEFARRVRADREQLAERFGVEGSLGEPTELAPLADDTHGDGRAVMRVTFESGLTVAYKPRSVDAGATFYRMLDRLDDHLPVPDFETPTYLPRDGYGWMEWIEYEECPDRSAVERYYRRAGALLCLTYLTEFRDCHVENVRVDGEQPVLVDAETVLHPYVRPDRRTIQTPDGTLVDESALLTALLPHDVSDAGGAHGSDGGGMASALAGFPDSSEEAVIEDVSGPAIRAANTDVMAVDHEPARLDREANVPKIDGEDQPPREYVDALVDGFERTYETVLSLRDAGRLADEVGVPDALAGIENRIVYRPTMRYGAVLRSLRSRDCLVDGARFGVEMERLAVPLCDGSIVDAQPWELYDAERRALTRLDPPRFTSRTDRTEVHMAGSELGARADSSGLARSRRRIETADREDMREQVEYVRRCFGLPPDPSLAPGSTSSEPAPSESAPSESTPPEPASPASTPLEPSASTDGDHVSDGTLRREARALFDQVEAASYETDDGTPHWVSIAPLAGTDRLTLQPAHGSLYDGRCGIVLLGAALYAVTDDERYRRFALDALQPVRAAVRGERADPSLANLGGTAGIGSVAYGLGVAGTLLDDRAVLDDATRTAELVTADLIEADEAHDVSSGAAGAILGMLAVHDRLDDPDLLAPARACGDHLLASRTRTGSGARAWETLPGEQPLTGFAHGASGIAYALLRLWDATDEGAYRDAAIEALEYESETYSEAAENWPDYRHNTELRYLDQWCYGRTGIGLARLGMTAYADDERITRGLERALGASELRLEPQDHLCCGNAGQAEFLLETARHRGRTPDRARELFGSVIARKRDTGTYRTQAGTRHVPAPTLFSGDAGIAYAMLRVTEPDELPCLLLWE